MSEQNFRSRILEHLKSGRYQPQKPKRLARTIQVVHDDYHAFRDALRDLMREGRVIIGASGTVVLPTQTAARDELVGTYRHNRRGFGFVIPTDPSSHEDLYIPEGAHAGALTGDIVRARIGASGHRFGKSIREGQIVQIIQRTSKRFAGTLARQGTQWLVLPDGNTLTEPILAPDAASRHIRPGTKVVVELTTYPAPGHRAQGVITEVLGEPGEKDVDLRSVIVQFNLPGPFPQAARDQARRAVDQFDPQDEAPRRLDLSDQTILTIDPDDAKDYDDAISLGRLDNGQWELGVHIADVSWFVTEGSALDQEARARGNSCYFPGHVIPMLPEILSNGVCSLQEGVGRLCKSAFIVFDEGGRPIRTRFANTLIRSAQRLRYREAQAIIDNAQTIPHPDGPRRLADYPEDVVDLLRQMDQLARRIRKRRLAEGQIVLDLPEVELLLDEDGKVIGAREEDQSFTHTIIEMFMVEANEAVARLLDSIGVPFIRRIHPPPQAESSERLRHFVHVSGHRLPKVLDRKAIQSLLAAVKGRPEAFAVNLAILKSLARAEYSPQNVGHYALASECYCHFTSPIRRYADLMVHRLLDAYLHATGSAARSVGGRRKVHIADAPSYDDLVEAGRHMSFTERRADDAERELRKVKLLELLAEQLGQEYVGVVTGVTSFGIFIQLQQYLVEGLIRYEDLMDDWWDVDERSGLVRGQRTGRTIRIGDVAKVIVVRVDVARRELDLAISDHLGRGATPQRSRPQHRGKPPFRRR
jgi:ribonuclease R